MRSKQVRFLSASVKRTQCCRTRRKSRFTTSMARRALRAAQAAALASEASLPSSREALGADAALTSVSDKQMRYSEISLEAETPSRASSTTIHLETSRRWVDIDPIIEVVGRSSAPGTPSACLATMMTSLEAASGEASAAAAACSSR